VHCFYGQQHQHLRLLLLAEDVGANVHRSYQRSSCSVYQLLQLNRPRRILMTRQRPTPHRAMVPCSIANGFLVVGLYIGWQWRTFFISYLWQLFFRHVVGQALRNVSYSDITFLSTAVNQRRERVNAENRCNWVNSNGRTSEAGLEWRRHHYRVIVRWRHRCDVTASCSPSERWLVAR